MEYIELNIAVTGEEQGDIITAMLCDFPFDSFATEGGVLKAYIPMQRLADCKNEVDAVLAELGVEGARYVHIETQNWNALWESNFEPVEVADRCVVRAPFHKPYGWELELVVMPKMSFGTGHHATTHLMLESLLEADVKGKRGLDMGSGTGVLAIAAVKLGAQSVDAIDIDEWAYENCTENCEVNGTSEQVCSILGDATNIEGKRYDFILANINRNILLNDMARYVATLNVGGTLTVSGILEQDIEAITEKALSLGLKKSKVNLRLGWAAIEFLLP